MPRIDSPIGPSIRLPAVAGQFYPDDPDNCRREASELVRSDQPTGGQWIAGIVPHAGWVCSGAIAGETIAVLKQSMSSPDVVVVLGAIHSRYRTDRGEMDAHRVWRVPTGDTELDEPLKLVLVESRLFGIDARFHEHEHAIEVELPLIQQAWPEARLLPVEVPPAGSAVEIGRELARQLHRAGVRAVVLASSDLTHYGPAYGFTPAGVGPGAFGWAKDNDRRLLDKIEQFDVEGIVPEAIEHQNACGPGAIAAMLAVAREFGADMARVLQHQNSYETLGAVVGFGQRPRDAVGYAGVVIGPA